MQPYLETQGNIKCIYSLEITKIAFFCLSALESMFRLVQLVGVTCLKPSAAVICIHVIITEAGFTCQKMITTF